MRRNRAKGESRPMTFGQALAAKVRLIVSCKTCGDHAEPDVATQVATMPVPDWARFLRGSECGAREVDFVVSSARRQASLATAGLFSLK